MSDLLKHLIRKYLPRGLYARSILLVLFPLFLFLASITFIFQDSHWRHASRKLSQATAAILADKVQTLEARSIVNEQAMFDRADYWLKLRLDWSGEDTLPAASPNIWYSPNDEILDHELSAHLDMPFWFDVSQSEYVYIQIQTDRGILSVQADRDRVFSTHGFVFIFWAIFAVLIVVIFTLAFLRNHVKSVLKLSEVAQALGKGQTTANYKPFGAREVRAAAQAILDMHQRITSFNTQRTDMLAGVSHDLRTPLTRLRLALATQPDSDFKHEADQDLQDMSDMLHAYLDFAKEAKTEPNSNINLAELCQDICAKFDTPFINSVDTAPAIFSLQPINIRRAIENLIKNATEHGENTYVSLNHNNGRIYIDVEDDGVGIPPAHYEAAFQPFNRLDPARNQNATGTGLGLTIARDIVREHGGDITFSKSALGGLCARISLPI